MRILAYLDAGSGSVIASAIAAGFAGIAVVVKMGWRRTLGALSPKRRRAVATETQPEPAGGADRVT
jgi:hypothetical protein